MPKVPRYQQQVRPAPLPTPSTRIDPGATFQGGAAALQTAGQGLQQVAGVVGQAQERIARAREQAEAAAIMKAEAELSALYNETLYTGPEALFLTKKGAAAVDAEKGVRKRLQEATQKLGERFQGKARETWDMRAGSRWMDTERRIVEYSAQQVKVEKDADARMLVQQGLANAAIVYDDKKSFALELASVESAVAAAAGDIPAERKARVDEVRGLMYQSAISAAAEAKRFDVAEQLLKESGNSLPPGPRRQLERTVETAKADVAANAKVASIILGAVDERTGWVNEARAWAEVDKAPAGEERDALRQRVAQRLQEAKRARDGEVEAVFSRAFSGYLSSGSRGIASEDKAWLVQRAPEEWRRLQQMIRADADRWRVQQERQERERAPQVTEEQRVVEAEIRARIQADPEGWAQRPVQDILADAAELGVTLMPSQVRTLGTVLAGVKGRVARDEREGRTVSNAEWKAQVDADLTSLGITSKKSQTKARAYLNERRARYMEENGGKAPPREEVSRWRTEAFTQYDGGWLRPRRYGFERPSDATDDPLAVGDQPYGPARLALGSDETVIEDGLDLRGEPETGSFGLSQDPRREEARRMLRSAGLPDTEESIDEFLGLAGDAR